MALTVEELQIVLSCDATTAQKVLDQMNATVKAYTEKFQSYFNKLGMDKSPKSIVGDVKAVEKQLDNVTKAIESKGSDWKKAYEKTWGETFDESMAKAKVADHGEYVPSGKEIEWNPQGVYDPDYYNKAAAEFDAVFNHAVDASADAGEQIRSNIARWIPGGGGDSLFNLADNVTSTLQNSIGGVDSMPDTLRYKIDAVIDTVRNLGAAYREALETNGAEDKGTIALQQKFQSAVYEADRYVGKLDQIAAKEQQVEAEAASEPTRLQVAVEAVRQKVRGIGDAFRSVGQGISNVGSRIKTAFNHSLLGKFVHQLGRVMLRMAAMRLIRGTIEGGKKGLEELAKTSTSSAKAMNQMKAAGGSIKMALGAAVMPIVKALVPWFYKLAQVVTTVANAIAQFFARVTGQDHYTAVTLSDGLDDVSNSAGDAHKKMKSILADFDELVVISKQSGGGGGGSTGVDSSFSTVADKLAFSELGDKIRQDIENGDWRGVGSAIAGKLNEAIGGWDAADSAHTLSEKIKNALDIAIGFLEETDWHELGGKVATFFEEIDWEGISDKLFEGLGAAIGGLGAFLAGLFSDAWQSVKDWFEEYSFDDDGDFIISGFLEGIGNALVDIGTWIKEHIFDPFITGFKKAFGIASPSEEMKGPGEFVGQGILEGIAAPFKAVGTWLQENIVDPVKNWLEDHFTLDLDLQLPDLSSFSEVWKTLKGGTKTFTAKLSGVKDTVIQKVQDNWNKIETKTASLTTVIQEGIETKVSSIKTAWNDLKAGTKTLTAKLAGTATSTFSSLKTSWESVKTKTSELTAKLDQKFQMADLTDIKNAFNSVKEKVTSTFTANLNVTQAVKNFIDKWNAIKDLTVKLKAELADNFKSTWNSFADKWNGVSWLKTLFTMPKFAQGGVVYGPTMGLMGEYAGAKTNPEVIAPLSTLVDLLSKSGAAPGGSASQEQNDLLREQNRLLRQIAQKEFTISPSVQLGQVISRSQKLYART